MDILRFSSAQRYKRCVPLRQFAFRVTVSRAFLVEEKVQDTLCDTIVPWDAKVPSPAERLALYQQTEQSIAAAHQHQQDQGIKATPEAMATSSLIPLPEFVAQLSAPSLFTRPCTEDFIDVAEEDFPVDPPQGPSRLAPIILRQHRAEHQPNRTMYFMWAMAGDPEGTTTMAGGAIMPSTSQATGQQGEEMPAVGSSSSGLRWTGQERVMCSITMERDGTYFTSKPSLNDVHTLIVDATFIYSFKVEAIKISPTDRMAGDFTAGQLAGSGGVDMLSAVMDEVDELYTRVNSDRTELQERRRLLRDAARMAADTRAAARERASGNVVPSTAVPVHNTGLLMKGLTSTLTSDTRMALTHSGTRTRRAAMVSLFPEDSSTISSRCQFHIFGTIDRCVGIAQDTVFLRCQLQQDTAPKPKRGVSDGLRSGVANRENLLTTQLAFAGLYMDDILVGPDHVFNMPFEHLFVDDRLAAAPLRLLVTAFTEGSGGDGHQAPVGYCAVSLPTAVPGRHALRCDMWVPHPTGREYLDAVFVGRAPSLVDPRQCGPSLGYRTGISVKSGMVTDSAGTLFLTVNVMQIPV